MVKIVTKVGIEVDNNLVIGLEYDQIKPLTFQNGEESDKMFLTVKGDDLVILMLTGGQEKFKTYGPVTGILFSNDKCICVAHYDERHGKKVALISSKNLQELTNYRHDDIQCVSDDLYITKQQGLYGVINHLGEAIIQNKFVNISYDPKEGSFMLKV